MLALDHPLWNDLHPGTRAPAYPARLRQLRETIAAGKYTPDSLGELCTMCDQWSTFDSTLAAVPHLVQICREQPAQSTARIDLLAWVGWCVACVHLNRQDGPEPLKRWYGDSVPVARDLIAESLPFVRDPVDSQHNLRKLLAAFAACHGKPALAFILFELESGGFKCDHCRSFIRPMESSMNPLWDPNEGGQ